MGEQLLPCIIAALSAAFFQMKKFPIDAPFFVHYSWGIICNLSIFYTRKLVFMIQNWIFRSACYLRPKTQQRLTTSHFPPTDPAIWLHFQSIHHILAMFPTKPFFYFTAEPSFGLCSVHTYPERTLLVFPPEIFTVPL